MIYFDSKYLSEILDIKPSKWKRWAREFLEPDPLGGYQSGYARQFSPKDAFRVFLGGHLVCEQKFSISDARKIIGDLDPWMKKNGFYALPDTNRLDHRLIRHLYIYRQPNKKITYGVRTIQNLQSASDNGLWMECYALELIGDTSEPLSEGLITHARILLIDRLYAYFIERVTAPAAESPQGTEAHSS